LRTSDAEEYFEKMNTLDHEPKLETFLKFRKSAPGEKEEPKPEPEEKIMTIWNLNG